MWTLRYGPVDFSAKRVFTHAESHQRLKTDYIDLYQAHDVEFGDLNRSSMKPFPPCVSFRSREGSFVGISGYPVKVLVQVAKAAPVITLRRYCRYNLLINRGCQIGSLRLKRGNQDLTTPPTSYGVLKGSTGMPSPHAVPKMVANWRLCDAQIFPAWRCVIVWIALVSFYLAGMSKTNQVRQNLELLR
jgi:L-galactose dehydrogenase